MIAIHLPQTSLETSACQLPSFEDRSESHQASAIRNRHEAPRNPRSAWARAVQLELPQDGQRQGTRTSKYSAATAQIEINSRNKQTKPCPIFLRHAPSK
jgi:hypothetical protein